MPIYDYQCSTCGHRAEVLRKISDAPLTTCPACGKETFDKQLSAAGFQLKGSGWYQTDFKGGSSSSPAKTESASTSTESSGGHSCGTGGCGHCA
ncbi:MAG: zinc ribbon domain-containing protein [Burkholderiales bacterium]|nr:zinc ribbon domain-containing protein [Burkholderiales bacterium]